MKEALHQPMAAKPAVRHCRDPILVALACAFMLLPGVALWFLAISGGRGASLGGRLLSAVAGTLFVAGVVRASRLGVDFAGERVRIVNPLRTRELSAADVVEFEARPTGWRPATLGVVATLADGTVIPVAVDPNGVPRARRAYAGRLNAALRASTRTGH